MSNSDHQEGSLVDVITPEIKRGSFIPGFGKSKFRVPAWIPGTGLVHARMSATGEYALEMLLPKDAESLREGAVGDLLYRVCALVPRAQIALPALKKDAQDQPWDLLITVSLSVVDGRKFLGVGAIRLVTVGSPLSIAMAEHWISAWIRQRVSDEIESTPLDALRDHDACPPIWWGRKLNEWLAHLGLQVENASTRWESESVNQNQTQRRFLEEARRLECAQGEEQKNLLRQKQHQAEFDATMAQLDHDQSLTAEAREEQKRALFAEFEKRTIERQGEIEAARAANRLKAIHGDLEIARAQEELEKIRSQAALERFRLQRADERAAALEMAEVELKIKAQEAISGDEAEARRIALRKQRDDADLSRRKSQAEAEKSEAEAQIAQQRLAAARLTQVELEQKETELRRRHGEITSHLAMQTALLNRLVTQLPTILATLLSGQRDRVQSAGDWATRLGIDPKEMANLGILTPQVFFQKLQRKASADHGLVKLYKDDLASRNIGAREIGAMPSAGSVNVATLTIGQRVDFTFTSRRAGYVTFINPGSGGRFWLHVPNFHAVAPKVEPDRRYHIPGPELLPWEKLRDAGLDFIEYGPVGVEYLVLIVSEQSLIDVTIARRSTPTVSFAGNQYRSGPTVLLSDEEVEALEFKLDGLKPETWSAAVLDFRVMDN